MEHNIDLIKQIREAYAKEEGYKSFASMALNVNIVPRDITEIAKKYAEGMSADLQSKCERYEKALKLAGLDSLIEALNGGEEKEAITGMINRNNE